jgi:hypothetical protein
MKAKDCVSNGLYCAYTPKFVEQFGIEKAGASFELTGRDVIIQSLREKCLHQIITEKYKSEGVIFWTMFKYLEQCFVDDGLKAKSLEDCYDWTTVKIDGNEEVDNLNSCVNSSFLSTLETDNSILKADREWATSVGLKLHPSIVINGQLYYGDVTGKHLAKAICRAYKEAPDECELSWKINVYEQGLMDNIENIPLPELSQDYLKNEAESSRVVKKVEVNNMETKITEHPNYNTEVVKTIIIYHYNKKFIYGVIVLVVILNLGILFVCRRLMRSKQQQQMNMHVQNAVS